MLPAAAVAARLLLPVSVSVVYVIYKYWRSGRQTESWVPPNRGNNDDVTPNSGNNGVVPPNSVVRPKSCKNDVVPSDGDLAVVEEILKNDPVFFDKIRTLDPAVLDELLKIDPVALDELLRIDPAVLRDSAELDPAIIDAISELSEKEEGDEEADWSCSRPVTESSLVIGVPTNSGNNDVVPSNSGNNDVVPPNSGNNDVVPCPELSDRDLAILEEILKDDPVLLYEIRTHDPAVINELRKFDPAVLREMVLDSAEVDPTIIDAIRKLCLKRKEEDKQEAKGSCSGRETESENENGNETQSQERDEEISRSRHYPLRPEAADCSYYLKTGTCKFRSNCKFNHPRTTTKNNQDHFWSGGRKDGRDGSFNPRSREPFAAPFVENFMGLPIRPGERDCPYYMRNLSCGYGLSCRFNHPDPTPAGESDPPSGYGNGEPASLQGASSSTAARWSAPRSLNNAPLIIPPSQGIPSRNTEHNGYQQQQVEELPQRPGQPVCIYFSTTGDCKFKSNCKYHHPKNQTAVSPSCALNDKGLPLRPGQNICTQYSSYGICNSGPACKFDHPSL
ncbi:hypothetical protein PRUPE_5G158300 [Prunus persica]|uniref:C3H1-type domain-containing protein n=1 Tax=Prunus persica TaxID=3760 RepID=A0A251P940_PRUPE|nr:zinc finger CCCH domain-containing protein 43 isoform X1 [Prunus persica]ONI08107.1 hypothetical protein PRUPE_5G158300 [Prunus persica]